MDEKIEQINDIKTKIFQHSRAEKLEINRVPTLTLEAFKEFANKECAGDYGMALKVLVDEHLGVEPAFNAITNVLDDHEKRISKIENPEQKKEEKKEIKTLSGRRIDVGGKK
jgi:hypothetical protein